MDIFYYVFYFLLKTKKVALIRYVYRCKDQYSIQQAIIHHTASKIKDIDSYLRIIFSEAYHLAYYGLRINFFW
jgi:hypothetical protein